jgi:hypothetical protein
MIGVGEAFTGKSPVVPLGFRACYRINGPVVPLGLSERAIGLTVL